MPSSPPPSSHSWACPCSPADAVALLQDQATFALAGDRDAIALLPRYIEHYLSVLARKP